MAVSVSKYPKVAVNGRDTTTSKWSAVHQPIEFKLQRRDIPIIDAVFYSGLGKLFVRCSGSLLGSVVGSTMYISCGVYEGLGVITDIDFIGGAYSQFYMSFSSSSGLTQTGGFLNANSAIKNYYTLTNILGVNSENTYFFLGQTVNRPDSTGLMTVDASVYLKSLVGYGDGCSYSGVNWKDSELGGAFNIIYSENWLGHAGSFSGISGFNLYYYTNSAKQIQDKYGSNMGEYVPFENFTDDEPRAKFLSDFEIPTYFPGLPFSLSFIYSDAMAGHFCKRKELAKNINGTTINNYLQIMDYNPRSVNRLMLHGNYNDLATYLLINLQVDLDSTATDGGYIDDGYIDDGYYSDSEADEAVEMGDDAPTGSG